MALVLKGFALPEIILFPGAYMSTAYLGGIEENIEDYMGTSN